MASTSEELMRLADLRDRGALTEGEFEAQKAQVLSGGVGSDHAATAAPKTAKPTRRRTLFLAATIALFILLKIALGSTKSRPEQIKENCRTEFGDQGEARVNSCVLTVMVQDLERTQREKLERASR